MKATKISFARTVNTGNYDNVKIGIELEVADGERAQDVLDAAKRFIAQEADQHDPERQSARDYAARLRENYQRRVADPDNNSPVQVREAQAWLDEHPEDDAPAPAEDFPF